MNNSKCLSRVPNNMDEPFFSAELSPHRSLEERGFQTLMLVLGIAIAAISLLFVSLGAWPVLGFLGLDLLIIWHAFRLNFRTAKAREYVQVSNNEVYVCGVSATGKVSEFRFNPKWVKLSIEREDDEGISKLTLNYAGKGCIVGKFLNPSDLETFSIALKNALDKAK